MRLAEFPNFNEHVEITISTVFIYALVKNYICLSIRAAYGQPAGGRIFYGEVWVNGQGQDTWCESNVTITDPTQYYISKPEINCNNIPNFVFTNMSPVGSYKHSFVNILPDTLTFPNSDFAFVCAVNK